MFWCFDWWILWCCSERAHFAGKVWVGQSPWESLAVSRPGCCSCDFLKMPDWDTGLPEVRQMHLRHIQELHDIGVTMLRVDLSLFEAIEELSHVLNTVPWDFIYQEWWWEKPDPQRHRYIGHFRDITYRYKITHYLGDSNLEKLKEVLTLERGHDEIIPETSLYPIAFHDGRTWKAKPGNATYKTLAELTVNRVGEIEFQKNSLLYRLSKRIRGSLRLGVGTAIICYNFIRIWITICQIHLNSTFWIFLGFHHVFWRMLVSWCEGMAWSTISSKSSCWHGQKESMSCCLAQNSWHWHSVCAKGGSCPCLCSLKLIVEQAGSSMVQPVDARFSQQLFRLWGGFGWSRMSDGPPGCNDKGGSPHCQPKPVYVNGKAWKIPTNRSSIHLVLSVLIWDDELNVFKNNITKPYKNLRCCCLFTSPLAD